MTVSILIPHYGSPSPTLALTSKLVSQLRPGDEVIVSDDASPVPFPPTEGIQVVRRSTNGGFGANCNHGAAIASGDLLLFMNSDLEVGPTFLQDLRAAAEPWLPCVAGPRVRDQAGEVVPTARHFPTVAHQTTEWLTPLARWRLLRQLHEAVGHDMAATTASGPTVTDWLVGAVLLIPRGDFEAVGGFDERFFMNAEEIDLQRRLHERGLPAVYLPTVEVVHEGGGSSDPDKRRRWLVKARLVYAKKWGGTARLRAGLTAATGTNFVWNVGRRLLGRDTQPLRTARYELGLIWGKSRP